MTPRMVRASERSRRALQLRRNGLSYRQIANAMGYADGHGAHRAVCRALAREREITRRASGTGKKVDEAWTRLMRCRAILDPAEHEVEGREAKAAMREAYFKVVEASDALARALGI